MTSARTTKPMPSGPQILPAGGTPWKTTGWQGITLETPPAWNLVGFGGDQKTGSLRMDNAEAKGGLGIEIRWSQGNGKAGAMDLDKRLEPFFKQIEKSAKTQKLTSETKSSAFEHPGHPERGQGRAFRWKGDRKGVGRIWACAECGRVTIAQVIGDVREDLSALADRILETLRCHPAEIGWRTWALYDLHTQIPADYLLKGTPQLMNIYVRLDFVLGQSLDTISVEQWGAANLQLRGAYLSEWFQKKNETLVRTAHLEQAEEFGHGHPMLGIAGKRAGLIFYGQAAQQAMRLQKPAVHFAGKLWECPESNKVIMVQCSSRAVEMSLLDKIVDRTICHS